MQPVEILVRANKLGITLAAEGGCVVARPKGATPSDLAETVRRHKAELLAVLAQPHSEPYDLRHREEDEIDRLAGLDGWRPLPKPGHPAYSIITTCRQYGVALSIDESGALVVGKGGAKADHPSQPWRSLLMAIEAHPEAVAALLRRDGPSRQSFPKQRAA